MSIPRTLILFAIGAALILAGVFFPRFDPTHVQLSEPIPLVPAESPQPTATPPVSPTPTPMSFSDRTRLYGPCAIVPILMYHHIEDIATATKEGHKWLAVAPDTFRQQMEYLRDHGYTVIGMDELINFFDNGIPLSKKPVLLTFDDAYNDFATNAVPVLRDLGFHATLFVPTGLVENPGYLTWNDIANFPRAIELANHTWSHRNVLGSAGIVTREITVADAHLSQRGYNPLKVFAYPYGPDSSTAQRVLTNLGYKLAFTVTHGSILCKGQRLDLPRIRIGNGVLPAYGL